MAAARISMLLRRATTTTPVFRSLRPLYVAASSSSHFTNLSSPSTAGRCFATRATSSSLNDPSPNWSNRPPKETILLDGCDFEHWLVVVEKPQDDRTRDEIIDSYIKTLAQVVGSEEEARMKIYSVSTRHYFAFGALVSEELSLKLKELPNVRWVLPDSYLDVKNKDYGGEPFIDGQAVPYDPKYHEEWVRNNARANERNRRNDRPRNFDRSRNFDRRRENTQGRDFQNPQATPPMGNPAVQNPGYQQNVGSPGAPQPQQPQYPPPPHNMGAPGGPPQQYPQRGPGGPPPPNQQMGGWPRNNDQGYAQPTPPPHNQMGGAPANMHGGVPQGNNMGRMPPPNMGGGPAGQGNPGWSNGGHGNIQNGPPPHNQMGGSPANMHGGVPQGNNMGRMPPPNMGGGPAGQGNPGWSNGGHGNFQNGPPPPNNGGVPYQGEQPSYPQNGYPQNRDGNLSRY